MIPDFALASRQAFETYCQAHAGQAITGGNHVQWANILGEYPTALIPTDESITPHLKRNGYWESWVSLAFARACRPGAHVLDVGANMGYFTVLAHDRIGEQGRIWVVEPSPQAMACLVHTISHNHIAATLREVAAWSDSRFLTLHIPQTLQGGAFVAPDGPGLRVMTKTLDELVPVTIDVAKIDVEGAEPEVWAGMQELLTRSPHIILLMEVDTRRYPDRARAWYSDIAARFPLRYVAFDGSIQPTTVDELMHLSDLTMLYLTRREVD